MNAIDTMLAAYVECALWSSTDEADERGGEPLDANYSADDIDPDTLATMRRDVVAFYQAHEERICHDVERAGHDLWLTRNGHGAGFWDGDWPEPAATMLTDAARALGERHLYVGDDGAIHIDI